jgi:carboxylesterase type B
MLPRLPGGFNATSITQSIYDGFVSSSSCAHLVGSLESIDCLREVPFEEINHILEGGLGRAWTPALDGDFFQDYTSNQLEAGRFVQVPLLAGANTDEGVSFRQSGTGGINTDDELADLMSGFLISDNVVQTTEELVAEVLKLYPNDQSVGIPSLERWPHIIQPGDSYAQQLGAQYRRESTIMGDFVMHYPRRRANLAWTAEEVSNYAYRFNVMPYGGTGPQFGSNHFKEASEAASC